MQLLSTSLDSGAVFLLGLTFGAPGVAIAKIVLLVTESEASLPDAPAALSPQPGGVPGAAPGLGRGLEAPGPRIVVMSPEDGHAYAPPVAIDVRFEPAGDGAVDLGSLKVEYLKFLTIDITDRVRPYVSTAGIRIEQAELPAGRHRVRISIADLGGAVASRTLEFTVR